MTAEGNAFRGHLFFLLQPSKTILLSNRNLLNLKTINMRILIAFSWQNHAKTWLKC